jgi:hypothetical protein
LDGGCPHKDTWALVRAICDWAIGNRVVTAALTDITKSSGMKLMQDAYRKWMNILFQAPIDEWYFEMGKYHVGHIADVCWVFGLCKMELSGSVS